MKPLSLKEEAVRYRKQGYSYNMISQKLGLAKSTLSNWLKDVPFEPNNEVIKRIGQGKLKSAQFKNKQRINNILEMKRIAKKELGKLTKRDLWLLGIGLYLGEGAKLYESIRIINSDPDIIKISLRWFREICALKNENFRPAIHLYPDSDLERTLIYWSKITKIPKKQFGKTQIDQRKDKSLKKKRKLPYGTLHLYVKSCGKKEFGRSLHRRIMGWIDECFRQLSKQ